MGGEITFTSTLVPNATSKRHSEPFWSSCTVGAATSTGAVSWRPGRVMVGSLLDVALSSYVGRLA